MYAETVTTDSSPEGPTRIRSRERTQKNQKAGAENGKKIARLLMSTALVLRKREC